MGFLFVCLFEVGFFFSFSFLMCYFFSTNFKVGNINHSVSSGEIRATLVQVFRI